MNTILLQAQGQGGGMGMIIMLVVLFAIMYFFMIRPQNKKQKEIQKFRNELTVGQEVVTIGGVYGTIKSIDEVANTVTLEVATGVKSFSLKKPLTLLQQIIIRSNSSFSLNARGFVLHVNRRSQHHKIALWRRGLSLLLLLYVKLWKM